MFRHSYPPSVTSLDFVRDLPLKGGDPRIFSMDAKFNLNKFATTSGMLFFLLALATNLLVET